MFGAYMHHLLLLNHHQINCGFWLIYTFPAVIYCCLLSIDTFAVLDILRHPCIVVGDDDKGNKKKAENK